MVEIMNKKMLFYDVLDECEKRIASKLRKLHIKQPHNHYYEEGLYLLWTTYRVFDQGNEAFLIFADDYIESILVEMKKKNSLAVREQIQFRQSMLQNNTVGWKDPKSIHSVMAVNRWKWVYTHIFSELVCNVTDK
ncbi:hypothetical protein VBD025_07675 [Virgibacillus flavescens]|uniref:hypothetical protein n=1 Tax=Virgibacillus flavescens TaxID=1611422 RepID=UPI003D33814B